MLRRDERTDKRTNRSEVLSCLPQLIIRLDPRQTCYSQTAPSSACPSNPQTSDHSTFHLSNGYQNIFLLCWSQGAAQIPVRWKSVKSSGLRVQFMNFHKMLGEN